ncbi:MAG: BamA/TamA family outer membrane protein [Flammeovirgaceae bacterium]|nr:MAG: BamA/TamA family outer membrane protein [Flammeovirgaceae bacterium]
MLNILCGFLISFSVSGYDSAVAIHYDSLKKPAKEKKYYNKDTTGYYLHINRIFIIGNRRTRERIILRELTLKPGDSVHTRELPVIIEKDKYKLFNLALFNTTNIRTLELTSGQADLLVEVDERWYTFPVPIFQLSDRNFNEWWENYNHDFDRINYGLKLYQYNMRGRNETLIFTAQFGYVKRFELLYRVPYFDRRQKQGLIFESDYIDAKNLPVQTVNHKLDFLEMRSLLRNTRGIGLTYTYRNGFYKQHRWKYGYRTTHIADTVAKINENYLGTETNLRQRYDLFSYQFISDHRDVVAYPLKGHQLNAQVQKTGVFVNSDISKIDVSFSYSRFFDLKKNFFLSNLSFAYWSNRDDIPYFNYGVMGYNKIFVRGYELFVIEGPWYVLNKTTLKKRIFSRTWNWTDMPFRQFQYIPFAIYVKTYADFGYVKNYPYYISNNLNKMLSDKLIFGTGFGVDLVSSYDVVLRFEYSFNAEGNSGLFFHIKKEF